MRLVHWRCAALITAMAAFAGCASSTGGPTVGVQQAGTLPKTIVRTVECRYLLFLPEEYGRDRARRWPLLLFLHGAGERGDDLNLLKRHGPPKIVEKDPHFPFIVVAPQCPANRFGFANDVLIALLDDVIARYAVDPDRVYVTGLSMGGYGTWSLACAYPERFAAIVPICGKGETWQAGNLKHVPVWAFHGAKDTVVPPEGSEKMVEAVRRNGGEAKLTIYPEAGHDSWTATYDNPELYEWLLKHRRYAAGAKTEPKSGRSVVGPRAGPHD
ncbi:MAG: prolyl oligopeptidase family serine peptidase [Phycisphaerae bacterium]